MRLPPAAPTQITGLILAGGRGERLGGIDKGLLSLSGRPLVTWVIEALAPQVGPLLISANRHIDEYERLGYPVLRDQTGDFPGPLAGIVRALSIIRTPWLLCLPCDGPCPPPDLASRLAAALAEQDGDIAVAHDGTGMQPMHALIPADLVASLTAYLADGGSAARGWYARHRVALADFHDQPDAFSNVNTPADLAAFEAR